MGFGCTYYMAATINIFSFSVLLYLLALNCRITYKNDKINVDRSKVLLYLRLLHIMSIVDVLANLLNTFGVAKSSLWCDVLNYTVLVDKQLQLLWLVLIWKLQVSTMMKALQVPHNAVLPRFFMLIAWLMVIIPLFLLVLNILKWSSHFERNIDPHCYVELPYRDGWVLITTCALNIQAHVVFLLQFIVQTHQAEKLAKQFLSDLKDVTGGKSTNTLFKLELDATSCQNQARSASKRNLIIGLNATVWSVLSYAISPFLSTKSLDTTMKINFQRASNVLGTLANNCFLYLIFAEWKIYLFSLCQRKSDRRTMRGISHMPLLADESSQKCFVKKVGDDEEVDYFAPPMVIYHGGTQRPK